MRLRDCIGASVAYCAITALLPASAQPDDQLPPDDPLYDCGTLALFYLLSFEGPKADLQRVEAALPSPSPAGYSMADLRAPRIRGNCASGRLRRDPAPRQQGRRLR